MAQITSRQSLAEYSLRALGGGVIEVEVTDLQLEDAIDNAIQFYNEQHYDGMERDYLAHMVSGTTIVLDDASQFLPGKLAVCTTKRISAPIISIDYPNNTITVGRVAPYGDVFSAGDTILSNFVTANAVSVVLGDIENGWFPVDDGILGVMRVLNLTSVMGSTEMIFNVNYQIMMSEIQAITSGNTNYYYSTMNYLGHIDFIMRKEKDFRFNRRMNKIFLDINWSADVMVGDVVVIEIYRALDEETFPKMLNDRWLKAYTTALIKRLWGNNLKKYTGMTLPGGLVYNGQIIFDEAVAEIKDLEQEALDSGAPLYMAVG
jgi:hypothetical protein